MAIKLIDLIELAIYHHYPLIPEVVVVSTRVLVRACLMEKQKCLLWPCQLCMLFIYIKRYFAYSSHSQKYRFRSSSLAGSPVTGWLRKCTVIIKLMTMRGCAISPI